MQITKLLNLVLLSSSVMLFGCGPANQASPDVSDVDAAASEQAAQTVENDERAHHAESLGKKKK